MSDASGATNPPETAATETAATLPDDGPLAAVSVEDAIRETSQDADEAFGTPEGRRLYAALALPFEFTHSDRRGGVDLTYITGEQAITRANAVLGFDGWSFKVLEHGIHTEADEVWVLVEITVHFGERVVVRQQFGSQKIKRSRATGQPLDIGFDMKGATTDALKKALTLVGVGLYLSHKETEDERRQRVVDEQRAATERRNPAPAGARGPVPATRDEKAAAQRALEQERQTPAMPVCKQCGEMVRAVRSQATNRVMSAQEVVALSKKEMQGDVYCGPHLATKMNERARDRAQADSSDQAAAARAAYEGEPAGISGKPDDDVPF